MLPRKLIVAVVALAAACTLPQAAQAQTSQPDERAAAREYAYAAYRLRVKVKAATPQMNATRRMVASPQCLQAGASAPRRAEKQAETLFFEALIGGVYAPVAGALETFQQELDHVPTADPALIAGREEMRKSVEFALQVQPPPADFSAQLAAWARSGYADAALPTLQPKPIHDYIANAPTTDDSDATAAPLRRAAARMVELGVTKGQARRFSGETLFDGVDLGN